MKTATKTIINAGADEGGGHDNDRDEGGDDIATEDRSSPTERTPQTRC
jgi:hypothetical protein